MSIILTKRIRNSDEEPSEQFDVVKLRKNIKILSTVHNLTGVDVDTLVSNIEQNLHNKPTSKDLVDIITRKASELDFVHPHYGKLSTIVYVSRWHKETKSKFSGAVEEMQRETGRINKKYYDFVMKYKDDIDSIVRDNLDFNFDYLGLRTLEHQGYIITDKKMNRLERPQHVYMRYCVTIGINKYPKCLTVKKWVKPVITFIKKLYYYISNQLVGPATPGLFNGLTTNIQFISCFILGTHDSTDGITTLNTNVVKLSGGNGGIGAHISNVRSAKSYIKSKGSYTGSVVKHVKVLDSLIDVWKQHEKRRGAFSIWLEPWHADIIDFIEMKTVSGDEMLKCRSANPGIWMNSLLIERAIAGGKWSLFSESDQDLPGEPKLSDCFGEKFKSLYEKYEHLGKARKVVKARDLLNQIAKVAADISGCYICMKDHVNAKCMQRIEGGLIVKSSNLCCEIMQLSDGDNTASCNLGSVMLENYVKYDKEGKPYFDYAELYEAVKVMIDVLDIVVDCNDYPIKNCEKIAKDYRPVALGIMGLAGAFNKMNYKFISVDAELMDRHIAETICYAATERSVELAQEKTPFLKFEESIHKDKFQYELWKNTLGDEANPTTMYDWEALRAKKLQYGVRNSQLIAHMPTVSTAQISGQSESFEPLKGFVVKQTGHGQYFQTDSQLVERLIKLNLWDDKMRTAIMRNRGSVQNINRIPEEIRELHRTAWEIPHKDLIRRTAIRGTMVCQSSSFNLFTQKASTNSIIWAIKESDRLGLKTAIYYVKAKSQTSNISNLEQEEKEEKPRMICTDDICTMCAN